MLIYTLWEGSRQSCQAFEDAFHLIRHIFDEQQPTATLQHCCAVDQYNNKMSQLNTKKEKIKNIYNYNNLIIGTTKLGFGFTCTLF